MFKSLSRPTCFALSAAALSLLPLAAQAQATLSASPSSSTVAVGAQLAVTVSIAGIVDLYAHEFTLSFNPAVLQATGASEGSFLGGGGSTVFDAGDINNAAGTVSFVVGSLVGPVGGVNGSGALATLNFTVTGFGTSALTLSDALALDSMLMDIPLQLSNGTVTAVPEPGNWLMLSAGLAGIGLWLRRRSGAPA
jgi:Cohesin domain/PEP-CTERM motif